MIQDRHKVRIWDPVRKKMSYSDSGWSGSHGSVSLVEVYTGYEDSDEWKNYIRMDCTGRKDSEGNLVYEGDVVEFLGGARGVIVWGEDDCVACFTVEYEEGGEKFRDYDYLEDKGLKVLGNIYEGDTKNAKRD